MKPQLRLSFAAFALICALSPTLAAETLPSGSYIIPMDTDYQDNGMLKAYGLVYQLLLNDVPIRWCIKPGKTYGQSDFTATSTDVGSGMAIGSHAYRGGPFVIAQSDVAVAGPIVASWQTNHVTAVHRATASFDCDVSRLLVNAPTIAMVADGNQKVARKYMMAAAIPDSIGDYGWPDSSPDMLDPAELAGPTTTNKSDGKLFGPAGKPAYCQLMSMHWGVNDAQNNPEVVAEVRQFLNFPTHFFAECQAVNAYENHANGKFLTPNGFNIDSRPADVDFYNSDEPFGQLDGAFATVGGSEPSYTLPMGDVYKAQDITMLTRKGTPQGDGDVWMTGYLDGVCPPEAETCTVANFGKISYLGGHEYDVKLPISNNPKTQGTRLFLNSLFEAPCATQSGQPSMTVIKNGPATTDVDTVTWTIYYNNGGVGLAQNATIRDTLPMGAMFVSASGGGQLIGNEVVWNLGTVAGSADGTVSVTVRLLAEGTFDNTASTQYYAGLNLKSATSNTVSTAYCVGETDAELCTSAGAQCGTLMVSDSCGVDRTPDCDTGACDANAVCGASNLCACGPGWQGDGLSCTNIDECTSGAAACDPNATCADSPGSFTCTCNAGYFGNGLFCADTDECATGGGCGANATCNNAPGGFTCDCNAGYAGDGITCTDIDECATGVCDALATCTNSVGSFMCACPAGYAGDGTTCTDINECATGASGCDAIAICTNAPGTFTCACPVGYTGDGTSCADVDECANQTDTCETGSTCVNTPGSFQCPCDPGFVVSGVLCVDIDECADGTDDCTGGAMCLNNDGGFDCGCPAGFVLGAAGCADIDECADGTDNCGPGATCTNSDGSFDCSCPDGFADADPGCADIDECTDGLDDCAENATCTNSDGAFECACNDGFDGDGRTCETQDSLCTFVDCDAGEACVAGRCVSVCSVDDDCANGESCFDGRCAADACDGVECPQGQTCTGGGCFAACVANTDCAGAEKCFDGRCAAGACANIVCASTQTCFGGTCFGGCDAQQSCVDATLTCIEERCATDACDGVQCPVGERCADGTCAVVPCSTGSDCAPGDICSAGVCAPGTGDANRAQEGCGCGSAGGAAGQGWIVFAMMLLIGGARRRR